jgi:hypothetical protein
MADPNYLDLFYNAYTAARLHVPQERKNVFAGKVTMDTIQGEQKSYDDFGTSALKKKTTRFAQVVHTDNEMRRRWIFPEWYYDAKLVDKQDNIALLAEPDGDFIRSLAYAVERQQRDVILNAFDAAVSGGKNPGDTSYTFTNTAISNATGRTVVHDTNNSGAAGGTSSGLTVEKLILVREKFASLDIEDGTPIYMCTSFRQRSDLLREAELQSWDTAEVKALVDGRVDSYMGIKFVTTNAITLGTTNDVDGDTNVYECFAWIPEGIVLAVNTAPSFKVSARDDMVGDVWQIKADYGCNAIRRNEDMVLKVECAAV